MTRILTLACAALLTVAFTVPTGARDVRAGAARGGSSSTTASGRATYGYGHGGYGHGGYGHGGYGHGYGYGYGYPYYGSHAYFGFYGGWGWPYYGIGYGWPYYGWPYYYGWAGYGPSGTVYVHSGDREDLPAAVRTNVRPKKATVVVDGETVGKAKDFNSGSWGPLFLEPGQHVLEFSAPGYQTLRTVMNSRAGGQYTVEEDLVKGDGLDPRSVEKPEPAEPPVSVPEARQPDTSLAPVPSRALPTGLLRVRVSPGDAAVYLDGEFLARADELARLHGAIPVVRGEHLIDVVMPGYTSASRRVDVGDAAPTEVRVDLERQ